VTVVTVEEPAIEPVGPEPTGAPDVGADLIVAEQALHEPADDSLVVDEPVADEPVVGELLVDDPLVDELVVDELVVDEETGDDQGAPPVVVVMVTHNPGWWFEETLASFEHQDYPNISVLVIDAASSDPIALRDRVAAVLPSAHLRRLDANPGFASAANEALHAVQGASFLLLCHDDVRLDSGVVRILVEEAFRSNAGVVGPKVVEWSDPTRLLSVGMGADRYGQPAPYVERGDLDQEQFDSVRDVFYVQGAVTLVRADLFEALGGFDAEITFHGEDLDLGWRAHVAGARVIAAPSARVAHLEALGERRPVDDRRRLQARHRLRVRTVASSGPTRIRTTPVAAFYGVLEVLQSLLFGRFRHARDITSAWIWNFSHASSARRLRGRLRGIRQVDDGEIRAFQRRGNLRLAAFLRAQFGRSDGDDAQWDFVSNLRAARGTLTFTAWILIAVYLLIGSRELLFGTIPAIGDMPPMLGVGDMFSRWVSGYQSIGLGSTAASPTGFGLFALLGTALLGAVGLLRHVLILGMLPLGVMAMWRLTRPIGSRRARVVATVAYLMIPVAGSSLARGDWPGLVSFAAMPIVLAQLFGASGLTPFGSIGGSAGPGVHRRPLTHRIASIAIIAALSATIAPAFLVVVVAVSVVLVIGGVLAGQFRSSLRVLAAGIGGSVLAFALQLPWSLSAITDLRSLLGSSSTLGVATTVSSTTRFVIGPGGPGVLGWALLVAGILPLLIGREWRLGWAVRCWAIVIAGMAAAWALGQGWISGPLPSVSLLLVPAAIGLALAVGLGVAAFEVDLPDYHFGWRQLVSIAAAFSFVLAGLPALGAALSGRWQMPRGDFTQTLSFLDEQAADSSFRVLWLGDAGVLPLAGWGLKIPAVDDLGAGRSLTFATSSDGMPSVAEQWAGPVDAGLLSLASSLEVAGSGGTARLGALVAPMAVRYIVVPLAAAPEPYATSTSYEPAALLAMLDAQLDLDSVTVNPGLRVYRNAAWGPERALLPKDVPLPSGGPEIADRLFPQVSGAPEVLTEPDGFAGWRGGIESEGSTVYLSQAGGSNWSLTQNGQALDRSDALGWASSFRSTSAGDATLHFDTPLTRWLMLLGQVVLWGLVIWYLLRVRVRVDESSTLAGAAESGTATTAETTTAPGSGPTGSAAATTTSDAVIASILGDES
jgi:GT2 family glycosyltransferase